MQLHVSRRARELRESATFAYLRIVEELRARGVDVISFGIGQPDLPTPEFVRGSR